MTLNQLINIFIKDNNYKIFKDGTILTKLAQSGKSVSQPEKWRNCVSYKKKGPPTVWYKYKSLQLKRIIYRKFVGELDDDLVIINIDKNINNNYFRNLKQVEMKSVIKPPVPNHPNYCLYMNEKKKQRVLKIENILNKYDLKWLNKDEYVGVSSFCIVKCLKGHVFTTHNTSIVRGYCYCPICSESYWFGETISRIVLEILLGFKFSKTKCIEGLEDPITGHNLEIDGFNLKNKIGFEYQGSQHYQFSSKFHKTKQDFKQLQNHDKIKKEFFLNKGWVLLEIKQFENIEIEKVITSIKENLQVNAPYLVYKKCDNEKIIEAIKVTLFGKKSSKSFNELLSNFDYLNKGMDFLNKHGAKLLSGSFKSKESKIVIETKQGLIWRTTVESLLRSIECNAINIVNKYNLKEAKLQEILKQANKYTDLTTFKKKHHKLSEWVRRNHYTNELRAVFGLEPAKEKGIRQYTDEYLINEAKKFKTRGQMYHEGRNAYELILLRKLQPLAFAHMVTPSRKKKK